jgi:hypothetical protein
MRIKQRAEVRRDALLMAAKKRSEGCQPCAENYADVALDADSLSMRSERSLSAGGNAW